MAVTTGNTSAQGFALANLTATLSHNHNGEYLVVGVAAGFSDGTGIPASVTYDGEAMTALKSVAWSSNCGVETYGLFTSNTGAHDIVVTYGTGEATRCVVCGLSLTGTGGSDTTTAANSGSSLDSPLTVTTTTGTVASGDLVVDMLGVAHTSSGDGGVTDITVGAGQTQVGEAQSNDSTGGVRGAMSYEAGAGSTVTMSSEVTHGGISVKYRQAVIIFNAGSPPAPSGHPSTKRMGAVPGGRGDSHFGGVRRF